MESTFAIHEYGHLREFQRLDIPVREFSLGIGPTLYSYQGDSSLVVSIRLIPIMAYVAPTEEGAAVFEREGRLRDKITVDLAGVRNNFLVGLLAVFSLQIFGWLMKNLSTKELAWAMATTPIKILFRFGAFLVGTATWGRVNTVDKYLLSIGEIDPPRPFRSFIFWNLVLGLFNLAPIPPLDGGHAVEAVLASIGVGGDFVPDFLKVTGGFILFVAFYASANKQDMRIFEDDE